MWGPGGPSCGVRFVCHVLTAMGGFNSLTSYNKLNSLPSELLDAFKDGNSLILGFKINGMAGTALFAWNFFQFGASPFIRGVLLFLTGVIDLGFAVALTIGCAKVAMFLPNSNGKCGGALDWKTTDDGWNLFNELVWEGHYGDATGACKSMLLAWIMTTVSIVFYYIVGVMNIVIGYFCVAPDKYGTQRPWGSFGQFDLPKCIAAPIFSPVVFTVEGAIGSMIFISRLFRRIRRRVKVWFKEITKPGQNRIQSKGRLRALPAGTSAAGRGSTGTLPLEIICMIAQHTHHVDMITVSQSSRVLRTRFFGDERVKDRLAALKDFTCGGVTTCCPMCNSQVCSTCVVDDHEVGNSPTLRHLKLCKPHCTPCYWALRCGPKRWAKYTRRPHHEKICHVTESLGSRYTIMSSPGSYYYGNPPQQPATARICRLCSDRPVAFRRGLLEAEDKETARRAWRSSLQCTACTKSLGGWGLAWWVCSWCGGDCADGMHPLTGPGRNDIESKLG